MLKKTKAQRVLGCAALLPYCIFFLSVFSSCFFYFFRRFFLFLSHSLVVRTRMSHRRQAPQTGPERRKKKKKMLSASRGSNRWDVKQKQRKKGTLSAKLWNTATAFMAEGKRKHRLAQLFCCVQTRFFFFFFSFMAVAEKSDP